MQLPGDHTIGRWLYEKYDIWQMRLLDERGIDSYSRERGLMSFFAEHITKLWQLGLLYADLIESSATIELDGLVHLGSGSDGAHYYADEREIQARPTGWAGVMSDMPGPFKVEVRLLFHPFRYYVLYHIDRTLNIGISSLQMLHSSEGYSRLLHRQIEFFNVFSAKPEFTERVLSWNRVSALAVAVEPCFFQRLFGRLSLPAGRSVELQEQLISDHWEEVEQCLQNIGLDDLEAYRRDLCFAAQMLDPNRDVHTLLRLKREERRVKHVKGRLGGSMLLLTMGEMLRRASEKTFDVELREEDELGFGPFISDVKEKMYGSKRILDGHTSVKTRWLQSFGLDSGVRLRWYVEGYTEYYALESVLGSYIGIDLVNLRGRVAERTGKGLAFRDSLRSDIKSMVFSFVSIDGDRSDYLRAVTKAAEDDEICGAFFVSRPDLEFQNFTLVELEEILWQIIQDECPASDFERVELHEAIRDATNAKDLLASAARVSPCLQNVRKGAEWGKRLMAYAGQHPMMAVDPCSGQQRRQVVDAIYRALQAVSIDYEPSRQRLKVDPMTGLPVARDPSRG